MKLPPLYQPHFIYRFFGCIFLLLLATGNVFAQAVSHSTGFYSVDSLFFTVNQSPEPGGQVQIAVNCFTTDACFVPYTGGRWLYNRSLEPNTWENQQLTRAPYPGVFTIDTLAPRGPLEKVNVVRVRFLDDDGEIESDKAYFIGVTGEGTGYPYSLPVVHLLVDSMDTFGPEGFYGPGDGVSIPGEHIWNYTLDQSPLFNQFISRDRVEKRCILEIVDTDNQSMLYQPCGIRVSGNSSRSLPNRSMAVVAREEYSPGQNRFVTDLYGSNTDYKWIRFRTGGSAQQQGFGVHEICERVIDGLKIGEVPIRPVITFLNGSYWSLSFAQDKTQEYAIEDLFGIDHNEVDIIRPLYMPVDAAGLLGIQQVPMDTADFVWEPNPNGTGLIALGLLDEGTKERFTGPARKLFGAIMDSTQVLTFAEIDSLLDVNSWLTFLAAFDYGRLGSLSHQIAMVTAPGKKIFLTLNEGDVFGCTPAAGNHWQEEVLYPAVGDSTFTSLVFRRILLRNPECIRHLVLRYEDLLNTHFRAARTQPLAGQLMNEILPEYGRHWRSWYPNAGVDSSTYAWNISLVNLFCVQRSDNVWVQLADQWITDENYILSDRNMVSVVLDSLPAGLVGVRVNTLRHDTSWTGHYYPSPALEVSMDVSNAPAGTCVKWKEYPDSALSFRIHADSAITLTPVLCAVDYTDMAEFVPAEVSVWPNPATDEVRVSVSPGSIQRMVLFSADGKKVTETAHASLSVQAIATGMYVLQVQTDEGTFRRKILISR